MRCLVFGAAFLAAACAAAPSPPAPPASGKIISIDYCADQMLLKLVERQRIGAVSNEVELDRYFAAPLAEGLPRVRPDIEAIMAIQPAAVVRSYGGSPALVTQLQKAGIKVIQLDYAADIKDISVNIRAAARQLDAIPAGEKTVAMFEVQLAQRGQPINGAMPRLLYLTPGGVTSGPGSLIDGVMETSGYANFETRPGWHNLPLEQMARIAPDAVFAAFFDNKAHDQDAWSSARHPLVTRSLKGKPVASIPGSAVSCGNWLAGDVVLRLRAMREKS